MRRVKARVLSCFLMFAASPYRLVFITQLRNERFEKKSMKFSSHVFLQLTKVQTGFGREFRWLIGGVQEARTVEFWDH